MLKHFPFRSLSAIEREEETRDNPEYLLYQLVLQLICISNESTAFHWSRLYNVDNVNYNEITDTIDFKGSDLNNLYMSHLLFLFFSLSL